MRLAISTVVILLASYFAQDSVVAVRASQQPDAAQTRSASASVPAETDPDAYEIYSTLLRTEVNPSFGVRVWTIRQWTERGHLPMCIRPPADQETFYRPVIEDFEVRNRGTFLLQRKFDLPAYNLVTLSPAAAIRDRIVLFEVSAVGFNREHTKALVYVAHYCGSLCGSGMYHLMEKKNGKWGVDREYHGPPSCTWVA